ncbi:MAG TPA: ABC transporter substrate-binding protein [Candidatus Limiplasma sp.]|nr:ABC transporter substrate-binding protein [Candidatus Limiplasma sp.]
MMKKILVLILCIALVGSALSTAALAESTAEDNSLIVGSVTQLSGNFFTGMWGSDTADIDVRQLLYDYQTIAWTTEGMYAVNNTAVSDVSTRLVNNNRRYTFTINQDLYYCDGTNITAKDYVFSILLESCPEAAELGGSNISMSHLVGYSAFATGESEVFSGVRLLGDYSFSLDVSSEYIPYFYEMAFANVTPYPMSVIAPGCDIADGGNGAYITGNFTTELLRETIMDPTDGYLSHPKVTSGAYMLTDYDADAHVATFQINPYYKGNYEGQKPTIEYLTFKQVWNETMLDEIANNTVGLINKVSSGEVISNAADMELAGTAKTVTYWRTGLAFISFSCEMGITQSTKLRQAIAHCIDGETISDDYLEGNGVPVYGYYGFGQWFVADVQDQLNTLNVYQLDTDAAIALLQEDGWNYNADGGAYIQGTDTLRYCLHEDGSLEPLALKMAMTEDNQAGQMVAEVLEENFKVIGASLEVDELSMGDLLKHYYRQTDREYNMFFLATNFPYIYDPYYYFNTADGYQGVMNTTGLRDEELQELTVQLRETSSTEIETYEERWLAFQQRFIELEPMIPLYSNVYYDIMRPDLNNYYANNHWSWSVAILYANIGGEETEAETLETTP